MTTQTASKPAIERAYQVWQQCGQNVSETVRELAKEDHDFTRQTIAAWRAKYDWQGRAARAEAEKSVEVDAYSDEALLRSLLTQRQKYETYFDSLAAGAIDNQATFAFNGVLKTIVDIKLKMERQADNLPAAFAPVEITHPIKTPAEAVAALETIIEQRINAMFSDPSLVSSKSITDLEKSLTLLDKLVGKYAVNDGKKRDRQLPKDTVKAIWEMYGIVKD